MRKMYELMMLTMAMCATMPESFQYFKNKNELTPEEMAEIERFRKKKEIERKKQQGLKLFNIDGIEIWALNGKNAIRKVNNLKTEIERILSSNE